LPATDASLRDRLANERTLLAWLRTAIALMGFGLVVARFGLVLRSLVIARDAAEAAEAAHDARQSTIIGAVLLLTGSLVALIGWQRTRAYARVIDASGPLPSLHVLDATSALVALLGVGLAVYIMVL
jgi:putative membrane protein